MSSNIGGFAAFMIAAVVAGTALEVTKLVINRPCRNKATAADRLWKEFGHQLDTLKAEEPTLQGKDLTEELRSRLDGIYKTAVIDAKTTEDIALLKELFESKLSLVI